MSAIRWQTQTVFGSGEEGAEPGNCFATCIASLLRLPLDAVPNFVAEPDRWPTNVHEWLAPRGLGYTWLSVRDENGGKVRMDDLPDALKPLGSFGYHLIYGVSDRGLQHAVIGFNGRMVHDPHPSRVGLTDVNGIGLLLPLDPADVPTIPQTPNDQAEVEK